MHPSITPVIVTKYVEALLRFYRGLLGATETDRYPPAGAPFCIGLSHGSSTFGLVSDDTAPAGPQRFLLSVEVDDVDALLPRVQDLGGTVLGPPDDPWGQRVAHLRDPDGNTANLTRTSS